MYACTDSQIGYLTFGSKVGSNIIAMYPPTSVFIAIGRLGIVLLNGLSYPLQCLPCRACVYHMTSGLIKPKPEPAYMPAPTGDHEDDLAEPEEDDYDSEDDPLIPQPDVIGKRLRRRVADMPIWKFGVITMGILIFGFIIALLVDELEIGEPPTCVDDEAELI